MDKDALLKEAAEMLERATAHFEGYNLLEDEIDGLVKRIRAALTDKRLAPEK